MEKKRPPIFLFTDGAASGNPGPGGFGVVLQCAGVEKVISGGFRLTTNNRMELLAVIVGLEAIKWDNAEVQVWSDSSYVVKALNEGWLEKWKRTGFKGKKNVDLWLRFDAARSRHRVAFNWLKGHAGHQPRRHANALGDGDLPGGCHGGDVHGALLTLRCLPSPQTACLRAQSQKAPGALSESQGLLANTAPAISSLDAAAAARPCVRHAAFPCSPQP